MRTISIDDDLYDHLVAQITDFGENPSSILRRLLRLPGPITSAVSQPTDCIEPETALGAFLGSVEFQRLGDATSRYLSLMSFLANSHGPEFERVLTLQGRKRRYIARSAAEIEASGSSTYPQAIPGTCYWALTNENPERFAKIASDALRLLGYSAADRARVEFAITDGWR